jgi:hypothetical protein
MAPAKQNLHVIGGLPCPMGTPVLRRFLVADSEHLRSRAAQLLVVAMKAYEGGEVGLADVLIAHAMQYLDEVNALGRRRRRDLGSRGCPE